MEVFHTGFDIINDPDLNRGRKNADFGPGFYVGTDRQFAYRWAKKRNNQSTYVNEYEFDTTGLNILHLSKNAEWFDFISSNRKGRINISDDVDAIIGPIANDTIYESFGILTSGFISNDVALKILQYGPEYTQMVIRSEKAKAQLTWKKAVRIEESQFESYNEYVERETEKFQLEMAKILEE